MTTAGEQLAAQTGRLRRFVARHVRSRDDADDIVQGVLLRALAAGAAVPVEPRAQAAFLFRAARNAIVDDRRRRRTVQQYARATKSDAPEAKWVPTRPPTSCINRMVDLLPTDARTAVELADVQGLPQRELAARLGLSVSGAKSRVQRARGQLRGMLLDCCDLEFDARGGLLDVRRRAAADRYCPPSATVAGSPREDSCVHPRSSASTVETPAAVGAATVQESCQ